MTLHEPARNRSDGVKFVAAKTSDAGDPSIGTGAPQLASNGSDVATGERRAERRGRGLWPRGEREARGRG